MNRFRLTGRTGEAADSFVRKKSDESSGRSHERRRARPFCSTGTTGIDREKDAGRNQDRRRTDTGQTQDRHEAAPGQNRDGHETDAGQTRDSPGTEPGRTRRSTGRWRPHEPPPTHRQQRLLTSQSIVGTSVRLPRPHSHKESSAD